MMKIEELREIIENLIGQDGKPVIVYAALWPFMKTLEVPVKEIPQTILNLLIDVVGPQRSLLMPTYVLGYKDGVCNLDVEPSKTGLLSELFRQNPQTTRTLSAFFSFNILGPQTPEVALLQPQHVWGDGSIYEWMENENVHFLMLGTHPTNCCFLHRMEWLNRVPYRYIKEFNGTLIRGGKELLVPETLFVRILNPPVIQNFPAIYENLQQGGMRVEMPEGIHIAHMRAENMKDVLLPLIKKDPFIAIKNREDFER
jgi:aminoglycoside 3-N-acetyltransferase